MAKRLGGEGIRILAGKCTVVQLSITKGRDLSWEFFDAAFFFFFGHLRSSISA